MLVLSRKESERIRLGDSIIITVVRVSGDKVRLGIDAPPNVLVLREELQPHQSKPDADQSPVSETGRPQAASGEITGVPGTIQRAVA